MSSSQLPEVHAVILSILSERLGLMEIEIYFEASSLRKIPAGLTFGSGGMSLGSLSIPGHGSRPLPSRTPSLAVVFCFRLALGLSQDPGLLYETGTCLSDL